MDRRYLRLAMWLLVPAAFFNGYDGELRPLLLPQLQHSFHVGVATIGVANIPITLGASAAFFGIRLADRFGRRPLLLVSLAGYTLFTALSAAAWSIWSFIGFQFGAQVFLGTEGAVAVLVVAEEFPPDERGRALGRLLITTPLGAVAVGLLLLAGLQSTALGWRAFYLIGVLPLLIVTVARRRLRETPPFEHSLVQRALAPRQPDFFAAWRRPWTTRLIALGAINFLWRVPAAAAAGWWVYYAEKERHYDTHLVVAYLAVATLLGSAGYYVCGRAIDHFGRRPIVTVYVIAAAIFAALLFQADGKVANFLLLLGAVFFGLGLAPAMTAITTELFPTEIRAQAGAWVGNGFANAATAAGFAAAGLLAGAVGNRHGAPAAGIGNAVSLLSLVALPAIPILWIFIPETWHTNLEEVPAHSTEATP